MATQKQDEKQGNGGRGQAQAITVQRGSQERQLAREAMPTARRMARTSPFSIMRRMLDDFDDLGTLGSPLGGASPFSMMRRVFDDMERMFEASVLDTDVVGDVDVSARELGFAPPIEIAQRGDRLLVRAEIPGVPQDQIRVTCEDNRLVIEGERALPSDPQEDLLGSERAHGKFRRVIALPDGADANKAEARFDNGVLEVSMPAPALQARTRKIEVKTGGTADVKQAPPIAKSAAPQPQAGKH